MTHEPLKAHLHQVATQFIALLMREEPSIQEGTVMTTGPAPYRRLDCDGRALAYVRTRPKKRAVRVDMTGLWCAPGNCRLQIPQAGGAATLMLQTEADVEEAVSFMAAAVLNTRTMTHGVVRPDASQEEPKTAGLASRLGSEHYGLNGTPS